MKEASGEANLTVVTIILIGVVVAIATPLINSLMSSTSNRACCTDAGGVWKGGDCAAGQNNNSYDEAGYKQCVENAKKK